MCISTHTTKNTWHIDVVDRQVYNCVWYLCIYLYVLSLNGWHVVFCLTDNRHDVTITTHAIKCHFRIWMTMVIQPTKHRRSCVLTLKYTLIFVFWWTRQRIHNTLIVVDRYPRLMQAITLSFRQARVVLYKAKSRYWLFIVSYSPPLSFRGISCMSERHRITLIYVMIYVTGELGVVMQLWGYTNRNI